MNSLNRNNRSNSKETNNYYNQLLMWTELDNKTLYNSEFRDIAYSLKEIK